MIPGLRRMLVQRGLNEDDVGSGKGKKKAEEEWPKRDGGRGGITELTMTVTGNVIEIDGRKSIRSVAFTADGKCVLSGGEEEKIQCWGREDGREVMKPLEAGGVVLSIAVSLDGKWIVSGAVGGIARVFDAESGEIKTVLKGHTEDVNAVDVSLDGTKIATGSHDGTARIWSLSDGKELLKLEHGGIAAKFSLDGQKLATARWDDSVRIFECKAGRLLAKFDVQLNSVAFFERFVVWHHDSRHIFVASVDRHIYHLDALAGSTFSKWHIHGDHVPWCIALASDSAYVAVSAGRYVSFWDTVTHEQIGSLIQHADDVFCVAISTNHDIATGADKTITVRNLRDILPSHYCDSTAENLHADLMDLQLRYKAQSRKLRQIAALKAELDRQKHSVALKTDKLAAVRQQLDQLSSEVAFIRNELRWTEGRTHATRQQYNDQLRDIPSAIANSQPDSLTIGVHRCITSSGTSIEKAIVRTLEELNTTVQRTSVSISAYFMHHIKYPDTENSEQSPAAQRISNFLSQSLVHHLLTMPHHILPWYLPVALRAYLISYLSSVISSWTRDNGTNRLIAYIYDRVRNSESHMFAASWRSLTNTNIPAPTESLDSDDLVLDVLRGLADVVIAAGCAGSPSDTQSKLSPRFRRDISCIISAAETLRDAIGCALPANFNVVLAQPRQTFDRRTMAVDQETGLGTAARGKILCTTRLGLIKEVARELPHVPQNSALIAATVIKAAVVFHENR